MKIAVSTAGNSPDAQVDPRFGRARMFMLYDSELETWQAVENSQSLNAVQGAGIQAADTVAKAGAAAVLTGHCGPKAFRVLNAAGIKVYIGLSGTVAEALAAYQSGQLIEATGPDVEGHW
jgi:predicted Fe-Mo cluster-binding NifX family protein